MLQIGLLLSGFGRRLECRQAYEITGSEKARSATNIAKWAIGVSTAIFAVALIVCILMFTVFSATVLSGLY